MQRVFSLVLNNFKNDSRVLRTCFFLKRSGYEVGVIALHDAGQLVSEVVNGIQVDRVRLVTRAWYKNKIFQVIKFAEWSLAALWRARRADLVHCNDLNTLQVGVMLKLLSFGRIKLVYDAHEFESNYAPNQSRRSIWLLQVIERALIRFADAVITVSDGIAEEYARLYSIEKPALVLNCPPYQEVGKKDLFREKFGIIPGQTIFLYQGGLDKGRGVEMLLEAFRDLGGANAIVFMGYGPLEETIKEYALAHQGIYFHPAVSPDVLLDYTSSADFGISFIENACKSFAYCLPNKMFEYLMAGLPVIVSNLQEMKKVVEKNGIGVVAAENTVLGLQEAIQRAVNLDKTTVNENIGKIKQVYCWEEQERTLRMVYRGL